MRGISMKFSVGLVMFVAVVTAGFQISNAGSVKPGDLITPDNAAAVSDLVSPGNLYLVRQGMRMKIVPTDHIGYPTPYKNATEKYSPQLRGRTSISFARSGRPASGAQGDVEFRVSAAVHRRRRHPRC